MNAFIKKYIPAIKNSLLSTIDIPTNKETSTPLSHSHIR